MARLDMHTLQEFVRLARMGTGFRAGDFRALAQAQGRRECQPEYGLRPALIAMVEAFRRLEPKVQHELEYRAVSRAAWVWQQFAPNDSRIPDALAVVGRFLTGDASDAELAEASTDATVCTREATATAAWNREHQGWMHPDARAAANLAQAVVYRCTCARPSPATDFRGCTSRGTRSSGAVSEPAAWRPSSRGSTRRSPRLLLDPR